MNENAFVVKIHIFRSGESAVTISGIFIFLIEFDRVVVGIFIIFLFVFFSVTIEHQIYAVMPVSASDFVIAGYIIILGGPAATILRIFISFGQFGMFLIGISVTVQTIKLQHGFVVNQTHIPSQTDPKEPINAASAFTSAMTSTTNSSAGGLFFEGESATWGPGLMLITLGIGISLAGLWD